MNADYVTVTETPGVGASARQLSMQYSRYAFAASFCEGRSVLEVACGAGQGLGYLARRARAVCGGDFSEELVGIARRHYGDRLPLVRFDAQALPFRSASFDVVLLYEAVYYLTRPDAFAAEAHRVLRPGGVALVCTVNREWSDFNPSPYSTRYLSAAELRSVLGQAGFEVELYGAFPAAPASLQEAAVSMVKRTAVGLNLIPKTMKGKQLLKRVFFGKLSPMPPEVHDGMAANAAAEHISSVADAGRYTVLYAVAHAGQPRTK